MNTEPCLNQREQSLQRRRERERARRQSESAEQREERLRRRRVRDRARRAAQSVEQRQVLLQRRRDRLIAESAEQRGARLRDLSARRQQQISHETEREPSAQLVSRPSVQAKMTTFHAHFSNLTSPTCSTCLESFPGLQLRSSSTECMRCSKDLRTPKLYSSANNMDPGMLPPQLQVSNTCI
jgi:hypothetical protein